MFLHSCEDRRKSEKERKRDKEIEIRNEKENIPQATAVGSPSGNIKLVKVV